jgi:hypothetical protein
VVQPNVVKAVCIVLGRPGNKVKLKATANQSCVFSCSVHENSVIRFSRFVVTCRKDGKFEDCNGGSEASCSLPTLLESTAELAKNQNGSSSQFWLGSYGHDLAPLPVVFGILLFE